ncbi:hypothetical protein [Nocardiopsis sp. LOL_012]|uniref:hypothetical protein n=1 Tax=Nocardiopsis sp. LOL_012 TaxID=3345409 RepID=UPI003A859F5A
MPGTALTLRVLMFIGATAALPITVLFGFMAIEEGVPSNFVFPLATGVYGVTSLVLALVAGRRHPAVRWSVLAFHILALVLLLWNMPLVADASGEAPPLGRYPFFFTLACAILAALPATGRYYDRPPTPAGGHPLPPGYGPGRLPQR